MALNNASVSKFDIVRFGVLSLNYSRSAISILAQDISIRGLNIICTIEPYYTEAVVTTLPSKDGVVAISDKPRAAIVITSRQIKYNILIFERDYNIISITSLL